MATTRGMLRAVAQSLDSPGEVLARVNDALYPDIPSEMFVTCFYAILDPMSGHLVYANAGHDMPYHRRRNGDAEELRARGMPLGLMPEMSYEEKETILQAGEAALLYSDGLVEAHGPEGDMFGFPRLQALVAKHGEEQSLGEPPKGTLHLHRAGVGAGGRHYPSDATMLRTLSSTSDSGTH